MNLNFIKHSKYFINTNNSNNIQNFSSNISSFYDYDKLLYDLIFHQNSNSINSFHNNFLLFKNILNFHNILRKTKIDSILKKCKSKFFRAVQEVIKSLLSESNRLTQLYKLPQSFITNVNIDCNKKYLNMKLLKIYYELKVIVNKEVIYQGLCQEKSLILEGVMNKTYKELFSEYLRSKRYQLDCKTIREKEGEKFELLFRYVSKEYINYYMISKGNKPKYSNKIMKTSKNQKNKNNGSNK